VPGEAFINSEQVHFLNGDITAVVAAAAVLVVCKASEPSTQLSVDISATGADHPAIPGSQTCGLRQ